MNILNFTSMSRRSKYVLGFTTALAAANGLAGLIRQLKLGGGTNHGFVRDGHYFLCVIGGACTEVTQKVWKFCHWHDLSISGTTLLVFIVLARKPASGHVNFSGVN
jgi:hypothetical protein